MNASVGKLFLACNKKTMKVLIAGCSLVGLATALSLITKFKEKKKKTKEYGYSEEDIDNDGGSLIKIVIVKRWGNLDIHGGTFGLAKNRQIVLQEIAPLHVLQGLQDKGIYVFIVLRHLFRVLTYESHVISL